jgi:hypothetical protein
LQQFDSRCWKKGANAGLGVRRRRGRRRGTASCRFGAVVEAVAGEPAQDLLAHGRLRLEVADELDQLRLNELGPDQRLVAALARATAGAQVARLEPTPDRRPLHLRLSLPSLRTPSLRRLSRLRVPNGLVSRGRRVPFAV